jgi:hypothetical protein
MTSPRRALRWVASLSLAVGAFTAIAAPPAGAANPVGYTILQGEGQCALASVDLVTGAMQPIGTEASTKCVFDLAFTPDGTRLFGTRIDTTDPAAAHLVEFDLATGAVTDRGQLGDFPIGGPGTFQGNLTFDNSGALYTYLVPVPLSPTVDPACDGSAFCLFQGNQAPPTNLTYVNHVPQPFTVYFGLASSCAGATTSSWVNTPVAGSAGNGWSASAAAPAFNQVLASVNLTSTGPATTDIGPITDTFVQGLDYDAAGTLFGVGTAIGAPAPSLFTIDPSTGTPTLVAALTIAGNPSGFGLGALAIPHPCPVPPPPPPAPSPVLVLAPRFTG